MRLTKESGASVEGCFFALPQSAALKKIIQSEYSPAKCRTSLVERYKNDALVSSFVGLICRERKKMSIYVLCFFFTFAQNHMEVDGGCLRNGCLPLRMVDNM